MAAVTVKIIDWQQNIKRDIKSIGKINLNTYRKGQPNKVVFTFYNNEGIAVSMGSSVQIQVDNKMLFHGYVFTYKQNRWKNATVEAYDGLRYLKNKDSKWYENYTSSMIVRDICVSCGIPAGTIEETGYILDIHNFSNMTYFDMVTKATQKTIIDTGKSYTLRWNPNTANVDYLESWKVNTSTVLKYGSTVLDYDYTETIDQNVYNLIQSSYSYKDGGMKDKTESALVKDDDTIRKWGILKLWQDFFQDGMSPAKAQQLMNIILLSYNRPYRLFTLECVGDPTIVGGTLFRCELGTINNVNVANVQWADEVTHTIIDGVHTMSITARELDNDLYQFSSSV